MQFSSFRFPRLVLGQSTVMMPSQLLLGRFLGSDQEKKGFCDPDAVSLTLRFRAEGPTVTLPPAFRKASMSAESCSRTFDLLIVSSLFDLGIVYWGWGRKSNLFPAHIHTQESL